MTVLMITTFWTNWRTQIFFDKHVCKVCILLSPYCVLLQKNECDVLSQGIELQEQAENALSITESSKCVTEDKECFERCKN